MGAHERSGTFELVYCCQIGEKPGCPTFSLHVVDDKLNVELVQPLHKPNQISQTALLSQPQVEELKSLIMILPITNTAIENDLTGFFELKAFWNQRQQVWRAPSNHAYPSLNKFFEWISKIYKVNSHLKAAKPLFPGQTLN